MVVLQVSIPEPQSVVLGPHKSLVTVAVPALLGSWGQLRVNVQNLALFKNLSSLGLLP